VSEKYYGVFHNTLKNSLVNLCMESHKLMCHTKHGFEVRESVLYHHAWVIPEVLYMLAVLCGASYDRTQVMCVAVLSQRCTVFVMSVGV